MSNKKTKWCKPRHKVATEIFRGPFTLIVRLMYHFMPERFKEQQKRNYLVLFNHQTGFDQFFVGMSFKGPLYYVAMEDLFSNGFSSKLIQFLTNPIPIKKQATDIVAVRNIFQVAKEGGSIAMAPEGNRTYSGVTTYINPAIAGLAQKMKLPIAFCRIEGGYGAQPRWSDKVRKGKMRSYVSKVMEPEEYASMTKEELTRRIAEELYVNEAVTDYSYKSRKRAEYMERMVYVCPQCGISHFTSKGNFVSCDSCGLKAEYLESKEFSCQDEAFRFRFALDWYNYQEDYINALDLEADKQYFSDKVNFYEVIPCKKKQLVFKNAELCCFGNRMTVGDMELPFDVTSAITVAGKNRLEIYFGNKTYQARGVEKGFNALKYMHLFCRYMNIKKGDGSRFLGM